MAHSAAPLTRSARHSTDPGGPPTGSGRAVTAGTLGMVFVGGSVAVAGVLDPATLGTGQAVRYALACVLLVGFARLRRIAVRRPRGTEWLWLAGVAVTGLVLFNVALVHGARHAEPAVLGVAVASVPLLLALAGPLLQHRRPRVDVVVAAAVVTVGAVVVQGAGRGDLAGLGYAALTLGCEAAFTLLAVPVLVRHGAVGVSVHTTWLAALGFGVLAAVSEHADAVLHLGARQWLALGYLAVAVTAVAFVLWYSAVSQLGPGRAGLLTGVAPVAATVAGVALGDPVPALPVWIGVGVVVAGLVIGLRGRP